MQEPSKDSSGDKIYVSENYVTWTCYTYEVVNVITRKSDGTILTEKEFEDEKSKKGFRKSHFIIQLGEKVNRIEKTNEEGDNRFIRDLFVEKYGELNDHRKWQQKNIEFVIKQNKKTPDRPETISIDNYLSLNNEERENYKESLILGKNDNPIISYEEYNSLTTEHKKYFKVVEEITEFSERIKDTHGHIFVKHDLFNHDPDLENKNPYNIYSKDGIAEEFLKFAKSEGLSFVK